MQNLSRDPLLEIILNLDVKDIYNLCRTEKKFSKYCDDQEVWKLLYQRDFPKRPVVQNGNYKLAYQQEYEAKKQFKLKYPFWYQHHNDEQLKDFLVGGWQAAWNKLFNTTPVYRSKKLQDIYFMALTLDPHFHFIDVAGKKYNQPFVVTMNGKPAVFIQFSPNISEDAIRGLMSLKTQLGFKNIEMRIIDLSPTGIKVAFL